MARTLAHAVRRTHLAMVLLAVAFSGVLVLVAGVVALRTNAEDNLRLMARSLVYNVEAALVFNDPQEATRALERLVSGEDVAQATVWDRQGRPFAQWQLPDSDRSRWGVWLASAVGVDRVVQDIEVDGTTIGRLALRSRGRAMQSFVLWGGLALIGCSAAGVALGHGLARRMLRSIVLPLQEMGQVARAVHRERALGVRVALPRLVELRELMEHFNALLDELEARQLHLQQQNSTLEHKAYHDTLTGLKNRLYFELQLMAQLREAQRTGVQFGVLFIDNDRFKHVNDTYGHATGDALLVAVAQRLSAHVRHSDLVARLGGDEFVVLMPEPGSRAQLAQLAALLQQAVGQPLITSAGVQLQPSISVGMALYPEDGTTMQALMSHADQAMYATKLRKPRA